MVLPSGKFEQKYPFDELEIGESITITGIEGNIRSAASMWGRRYGVWLTTEHVDDGVVKVTRIPVPLERRNFRHMEEIMTSMLSLLADLQRDVQDLKVGIEKLKPS